MFGVRCFALAALAILSATLPVAAGETASDDAALIATLSAHAADVKRHGQKKLPALTQEPVVAPPVTNLPPVIEDPPVSITPPVPDTPITYVLTGIISDTTTGRTMALLNNRPVAEGDRVVGNQRVFKIGVDYVVLVATQGVQQVVRMSSVIHGTPLP